MSADNWARCPRCVKRDADEIAAARVRLDEAYGAVPVAEFDAMRTALGQREDAHENYNMFRTFREDYEFYGAEDGEVTASYRGSCSVCDLSLKFEHTHAIEDAS